MTRAEYFVQQMVEFVENYAKKDGAEVSLEEGIVKVSFDDGTYADFTEPLPFDEDGNQLETEE